MNSGGSLKADLLPRIRELAHHKRKAVETKEKRIPIFGSAAAFFLPSA